MPLLTTINSNNPHSIRTIRIMNTVAGSSVDLSAIKQSGATTGQFPSWNGSEWVPITASGTGDMLASVYDPTTVNADAFDMDNMVEGTNLILTAAERAEIAANTAVNHVAMTASDSAEIDFTVTGQDITGSLIAGSIDESKLDASVNASLDLADSASQPGHAHVASTDVVATGTPSSATFLRGDDVWATPAGSGDVVGPASSTDNAVPRYDSTTGKLLQGSGVTINDSDDITTNGKVTLSTIELGNASDTTLSRASAGRVAVEGVEVALMTDVGGGGGLTLTDKTADANITAVAGEMHVVEMNSGTPFTASRNWTLPVAASVSTGDQFGLMIKDGDAAFEVNVRTGAAGDLLNGVDVSATSNAWALFQAGEVLIVTCIDGATGDYIVINDGRKPCAARIEKTDAQALINNSYDQVELNTETYNRGLTTDVVTNYRITVRRDGLYNVSSLVRLDDTELTFNNADWCLISVYLDGVINEVQHGNTGADSSNRIDARYNTTYELTAGQYLETFVFTTGTTGCDLVAASSAPNWLAVKEIL